MGHLGAGQPLSWEETQQNIDKIKKHAIEQLVRIWRAGKDRTDDPPTWGDEIEYMVVIFDDQERNAKLWLCQEDLLPRLASTTERLRERDLQANRFLPEWQLEYGRYMVESAPGVPYNETIEDWLSVEKSMRDRRLLSRLILKAHERIMTLTAYPRLGAPDVFTEPPCSANDAVYTHSLFLPDETMSANPKMSRVSVNIRQRRGSKVGTRVPIFRDEKTPDPFHDETIPLDRNIFPEDKYAAQEAAHANYIYLDATGFGAGCCCLQATMQAKDLEEALKLYDAMTPLAPIMLALTAASPAQKGYLVDVDCRWDIISGTIDDRTKAEKDSRRGDSVIPKSRWSTVDTYLSNDVPADVDNSDIPLPYSQEVYDSLRDEGLPDTLAMHFAHIFIRDPLLVYPEAIEDEDPASMDNFEAMNSTNWQSIRLKPPVLTRNGQKGPGWRVEFRSMEVQMTDYENAACVLFIYLLSRATLKFDLQLYLPISKIDENMQRAQRRDAARQETFWFRREISRAHGDKVAAGPGNFTLGAIINGGDGFPGLMSYINGYLDDLNLDTSHRAAMERYLELIRRRADGSLQTAASWIRGFVRAHPEYKADSVISQEVNFDLVKAIDEIERGLRRAPELLPAHYQGSMMHEQDFPDH